MPLYGPFLPVGTADKQIPIWNATTGRWELQSTAWTTYSPTWTATGTQPAIGNGTIEGRFLQINKTTYFRLKVTSGTTTTYGTGTYTFLLPADRQAGGGGSPITGGARVIISGNGYTGLASGGPNANEARIIFADDIGSGADVPASATVPVNPPVTGSTWEIVGVYEAA